MWINGVYYPSSSGSSAAAALAWGDSVVADGEAAQAAVIEAAGQELVETQAALDATQAELDAATEAAASGDAKAKRRADKLRQQVEALQGQLAEKKQRAAKAARSRSSGLSPIGYAVGGAGVGAVIASFAGYSPIIGAVLGAGGGYGFAALRGRK